VNSTQVSEHRRLAVLLRIALVAALVFAAWSVYRHLPASGVGPASEGDDRPGATALRIVLRRTNAAKPDGAALKVPVQLYPINMTAARSEYDSEKRPGVRFEDFATRLMGDRQPVTTELDNRGEAVVLVTPGRWWVHVTLNGARELTWRLPVNASGPEKTVELTPENVYIRAKRF
jgi:hypothetical protein